MCLLLPSAQLISPSATTFGRQQPLSAALTLRTQPNLYASRLCSLFPEPLIPALASATASLRWIRANTFALFEPKSEQTLGGGWDFQPPSFSDHPPPGGGWPSPGGGLKLHPPSTIEVRFRYKNSINSAKGGRWCPASSIVAGLASTSFAGSPPLRGCGAERRRCGSCGRQTRG